MTVKVKVKASRFKRAHSIISNRASSMILSQSRNFSHNNLIPTSSSIPLVTECTKHTDPEPALTNPAGNRVAILLKKALKHHIKASLS
jgi:hypothetical protein